MTKTKYKYFVSCNIFLKKWVLNLPLNDSIASADLISEGHLFHFIGAEKLTLVFLVRRQRLEAHLNAEVLVHIRIYEVLQGK